MLPHLQLEKNCYNAIEAMQFLNENTVDFMFLDINMPMMTGIEFLKVLKNRPQVIITSAYQEYALQGFELDVTDYLLKPFRYDRFIQAVTKALNISTKVSGTESSEESTLEKQLENSHDSKKDIPSHIFIKVDRKQIQLALADICCFEAYGNYVKVWVDKISRLTPGTLTSFSEKLPNSEFIRIHKSAIVNKPFIDFIEGNKLHLKNGQCYSIAKQHKDKLKLLLQ